jgi:hypothetical protein
MRKALAINGQNVPIQVAWPALSKFYSERGLRTPKAFWSAGDKQVGIETELFLTVFWRDSRETVRNGSDGVFAGFWSSG